MSEPYWSDDRITLHLGDCLDVMREMPDASVDAVVTDPPSAISFMGKSWDGDRGGRDRWIAWLAERMAEACRVLKPGGHALVWSLPRTSGWTQMALEDAGFEVRDCIVHIFGSGYPKSLDVSKAIDKLKRRDYVLAAIELGLEIPGNNLHDWTKAEHSPGDIWWEKFKSHLSAEDWQRVERAVIGEGYRVRRDSAVQIVGLSEGAYSLTAPATEDAALWDGWGTSLKPGQEMWWLVRKPLAGTVAATVLEYGTGALNIAACKVGAEQRTNNAGGSSSLQRVSRVESGYRPTVATSEGEASEVSGRWPANIVFTHSVACQELGTRKVKGITGGTGHHGNSVYGKLNYDEGVPVKDYADADGTETVEAWDCAPACPVLELDRQSGASISRIGRPRRSAAPGDGYGMTHTGSEYADHGGASRFFHTFRYQAKAPSSERPRGDDGSAHVTVKSLGLMRHFVRLITPPGGTVLDCYAGSGPTAEACLIEGFNCILIELERPSAELIRTRLRKDIQPVMFGTEAS